MNEEQKREALRMLKSTNIETLWGYIVSGDISLDEMREAHGLIYPVRIELERRLKELESETIVWNDCQNSNTEQAYNDYLQKYRNGQYAGAARAKLEQQETVFWNNCNNAGAEQSYNDYLRKYPNGQYAEVAHAKIKELAANRAETSFWNECHLRGSDCRTQNNFRAAKNAYNNYLTAYPDGAHATQANAMLASTMIDEANMRVMLIKEMKDYPEQFDHHRLRKIFDDHILDEDNLIEEGIITKEALRLYLNPPFDKFIDQKSWGSLPPILPDKTDIYFFGIPGSGKSCVLAGLLKKVETEGILRADIRVPLGVSYMYELQKCISMGYVPKPTAEDCVNCLSFSLNESKKEHPLNIIEMSGEIFKKTYYNLFEGQNNDGVTAQKYLRNKNRKLIFFVIDYKHDFSTAHMEANQSQMLTTVLDILANDGILKQTDGIIIIISKSDYMPQNVSRKETAREYLHENYRTFTNTLSEYMKKYGINKASNYKPHVIPFSLGKFMLGRTFIYNPDDSAVVVDAILTVSQIKRKTIWEK